MVEYWAHVAGVHAGRAVAGDAAPDGRATATERHVVGAAAGRPRSWSTRCWPRSRDRGAVDRPRPRRRAAARQGALGLELVGDHARRSTTSSWPATSPSPGATASSRSSTTCPSGCSRRACSPRRRRPAEDADRELVRRAAPSARRRAPRAACADYYRLQLAARRGPAQVAVDELVEEGELLPVRDRGLEPPGVPPPRRRACRAGSTPGRCSARSTRWCGSASAPSSSSTSTTGSRSTCPSRKRQSRLLRAAVPARRPDRRPGRPQGRPARPGACWCKAAYAEPGAPAGDRRGAGRRAARAGRLAGPGRRRRRAAGRPGARTRGGRAQPTKPSGSLRTPLASRICRSRTRCS